MVEDSPDLRSYISSILSKFYNVVQVPDGQAGLDYALAHPPALILVRTALSLSLPPGFDRGANLELYRPTK